MDSVKILTSYKTSDYGKRKVKKKLRTVVRYHKSLENILLLYVRRPWSFYKPIWNPFYSIFWIFWLKAQLYKVAKCVSQILGITLMRHFTAIVSRNAPTDDERVCVCQPECSYCCFKPSYFLAIYNLQFVSIAYHAKVLQPMVSRECRGSETQKVLQNPETLFWQCWFA